MSSRIENLTAAVVGTGFIGPVHVEGLRRAGVPVAGIAGKVAKSKGVRSGAGLFSGSSIAEGIVATLAKAWGWLICRVPTVWRLWLPRLRRILTIQCGLLSYLMRMSSGASVDASIAVIVSRTLLAFTRIRCGGKSFSSFSK